VPKYEIQSPLFTSSEPGDVITFSSKCIDYCVGIVDIVNSTKISAVLSGSKIGRYYSIFLNTMGSIVKKYGGVAVKNIGDSLLYYFPETSDATRKSGFIKCLECNLSMLAEHDNINSALRAEELPPLDYRVSADYGGIMLAKSSASPIEDIFGPPVNMCSKINPKAAPNTVVIGGDLYQVVKHLDSYSFEEVKGCSVGFKHQYSVYTVKHNGRKDKIMVKSAIEHALLEISTPTLDEVTRKLFNEHKCLISDCYENPQHLNMVLKELFGNSHATIVESIRNYLGEFASQGSIKDFVTKLERQ
ncbi:MAG: adenylate/guanylate cyclase domain-containing protein, partial [Nitrosopumilaceae archaeon]